MDKLFADAMDVHRRFCDRQDRPHECYGQAILKRGEVCLDCPLCGKGEMFQKWTPQAVIYAESVLGAVGIAFSDLTRDAQVRVLDAIKEIRKEA